MGLGQYAKKIPVTIWIPKHNPALEPTPQRYPKLVGEG